MMDHENAEKFRNELAQQRDKLVEWLNSDAYDKEIHLGGHSTKEVLKAVSELKEALENVDSGNFGKCTVCHETVDPELLELDYTQSVCLSHYPEEQLRALENDLELASKVQRELLPCCVPSLPDIQIAFHAEPAGIVGGDYYDFFGFKNGLQGVAIADVMGKGLPASMLMSNLQASLRILGPQYDELDSLMAKLNELFQRNLKLIRFITIFLAAIDKKSGIVEYCNAGHHPPILWEAATQKIQWLQPTGPAIGLTRDAQYKSNTLKIKPGDLLLLYTDGLVESRKGDGEEFGEDRLASFLIENHNKSANDFVKDLRDEAAGFAKKFHDDLSLIAIKF
jgi:sigma-B regulation protein RsbU (phosphoserine phosphatase)